ncbi:siderophore-interacting protein [Sphingobacterium sp. UT-1RO-CII-1]|uniref:siderophore-interacting protein n=1 Tax=Sphingobacterium sp. UT-1RO-CII-1 TaxID=2995225 RepID=UPI00227D27AD|nr:siderophore-interacting protein [Sphingobacterium sp. UT-1RO-CII-1]MCY4779592.1 siderophore-interacting protein [Sphingobacterium sp. UT-1RO-CII-1]
MSKMKVGQHVFTLVDKEYITPHYVRVRLHGEGTQDFANCTIGVNNKIFIPPAGVKDVAFAKYDEALGEWVAPDESVKPIVRTYTHRAIDVARNEITIDFVDHGDVGPASSWARNAVTGDQLGVAMKLGTSELCPAVDQYLLVGDATAIPVLVSILEGLPKTAKGYCIIEVATLEDVHPEVKHEGFKIQWLFNPQPEEGSELAATVRKVVLPENNTHFAYVACEYRAVREIRAYFRTELGWNKDDFYAYSYWKAGVAEDKSVGDRQAEKSS